LILLIRIYRFARSVLLRSAAKCGKVMKRMKRDGADSAAESDAEGVTVDENKIIPLEILRF
jgi:hypothetical protein